VDRSGGDGEVYFRYAENFRITADVPAAKQLERMRPNETVTTELIITNSGDLENELTVKASLDTNNATGWSATIGQEATSLDDFGSKTLTLEPDGTISFPLKVSSPGFDVGRDGESIDIAFDILVKRASAKDVTLRLSPVLSVERDVSVSDPGSITTRGSDVQLAFEVTNSGDVPEAIIGSIIGAPQGWRFNSSAPVTLKPGGTVNRTFVNDGPVPAQNDSVQTVAAMFEMTEVGNASGTMPIMQVFRNVRVH
jgi:uncharacterized membrane protein